VSYVPYTLDIIGGKLKMNFVLLCFIVVIVCLIAYTLINLGIKMTNGIKLLNKGDSDKAIEIFSSIIGSLSKYKRSVGYTLRGHCFFKIGQYTDAFNDLLESIKIVKIPNYNIILIGKFFCEFKEYDRALKYFSNANQIKPNSSTILANLGLIYYYNKEYDKAIGIFNTAISYKGNKGTISGIYAHLGATYTSMKKYDKASEVLTKALDIYPENYYAHINYANLLRIKGNILLSKTNVLKAIHLNVYEYLPYKTLSEINLMEDNYIDFYKNYKTFLDKKPLNIDSEDIEDPIYDKVKNDEKFKLMLEGAKENALTFNDLNICIDDDILLSDKMHKKRRIIRYIIILVCILIMILSVYIKYKFKKS